MQKKNISGQIILGLALGLITLLAFLSLTDLVLDKEWLAFDNALSLWVYQGRTPFLTILMRFMSFIGSDALIFFTILIPTLLFLKQRRWEAFLFAFMISAGAILNLILKLLTQRPRPSLSPLAIERTYSFPSGHSMNSFIFFMTLAYFYVHYFRGGKYGVLAFTFAFIIILGIGLSRVYLGVHYPSDVLGGYLAGLLWLILVFCIEKFILFLQIRKTP